MNTIPVVIPIIIREDPDHCPKCKKIEDTVLLCRHCGYEYPEEEGITWKEGIFIIVALVLGVLVFMFVVNIIAEWFMHDNITLVQEAKEQVQFLISLFNRII